MEKRLWAGYGKVDYTPDYHTGLGGYGDDKNRIWEKIEEHVFVICVAVKNEEKTFLLFTTDVLSAPQPIQARYRALISKETGVPEEHIFFGATHAHNAPSMHLKENVDHLEPKTLEAAKAALADLAPAALYAGKKEIEGMNFTRHYITDQGERYSANTGIPKGAVLVGHSTMSDPDLTVLRFEREGKKDIVLVNWQAHCDSASAIGFRSICPSWAGRLRSKLEEKAGVLSAYFTGTSGNQAQNSKIEWEKHHFKWFEYGEKMGEYAASVLEENMEPVKGTRMETVRIHLPVTPNHEDDHLYEKAKLASALKAQGEVEKATEVLREAGIPAFGTARGIISRHESEVPDFLEIAAFCIGNLGVVTNTNETSSDFGIYTKERSPFKHNFIITGNRNYLAPRIAYEYYAYEALGASAKHVAGTGEKLAEAWVDLLRQIHE